MNTAPSLLVMVVDDDPDTRAFLTAFIQSEGYVALEAGSGDDALALLDTRRPDLVLLDAVMPGQDGFATCKAIKARQDCAHLPVIFMTGLSETEHIVRGLSSGAVDYVTKPIVLDELAARIRVHLANARTARSAMVALDSAGACLLSADANGRIGWSAPAAQKLLDEIDLDGARALQTTLRDLVSGALPEPVAVIGLKTIKLKLTMLDPLDSGQTLFRVERSIEGLETQVLQKAFGLTPREADVLLWTARGKSNKDMSEILNISARTVNKHLEQVFVKIGVENRTAAASSAMRILLG